MSLAGPLVAAATIEGQAFDDAVRIANRELRLNGLGLRAIFFVKVYAAGLYLGTKAETHKDVIAIPGPKRLQLRMLRRAGPDDFNSALVDGIRNNASEAEMARLSERVAQLERTINKIGSTVPGDVIDFDFVPELGTTLSVNGASKGAVIAGADFYNAVLGIFVGNNPVDARLKKGLLGQ